MYCLYCGSSAHNVEQCPKTAGGQASRNALRCSYCGGRNHNYEACPKIRTSPTKGGVFVLDGRK